VLTGRIARLNPAAVFISLLFWGWLWGIWGMLLGIPILVIVKVVSQHLEQLQPWRNCWESDRGGTTGPPRRATRPDRKLLVALSVAKVPGTLLTARAA